MKNNNLPDEAAEALFLIYANNAIKAAVKIAKQNPKRVEPYLSAATEIALTIDGVKNGKK